jgi:hypothetical protein
MSCADLTSPLQTNDESVISRGMGSVPGVGCGEAVPTKHPAMTRDTVARTRIVNDMVVHCLLGDR